MYLNFRDFTELTQEIIWYDLKFGRKPTKSHRLTYGIPFCCIIRVLYRIVYRGLSKYFEPLYLSTDFPYCKLTIIIMIKLLGMFTPSRLKSPSSCEVGWWYMFDLDCSISMWCERYPTLMYIMTCQPNENAPSGHMTYILTIFIDLSKNVLPWY